MSVKVPQNQLKRFDSENVDVKSSSCFRHPVTDKRNYIYLKVEQNRDVYSYSIEYNLRIDCKTVLTRMPKAGYLDIWVPHELTERNLMDVVFICDSLYFEEIDHQ